MKWVLLLGCLAVFGCSGSANASEDWPAFHGTYVNLTFTREGPAIEVIELAYRSRNDWRTEILEDSANPRNVGTWAEFKSPELRQFSVRRGMITSDILSSGEWAEPLLPWGSPIAGQSELIADGWTKIGDSLERRTTSELECLAGMPTLECTGEASRTIENRVVSKRHLDGIPVEYREYADDAMIRFITVTQLVYD